MNFSKKPESTPETLNIDESVAKLDTKKILLLEDDVHFAEVLKTYLDSLYYNVTCVKSGVEGLKAVMVEDFDVIVCDMLMPSLPGDMFYLAVEKTKPYLCKRFIFITGYKGVPKIDNFIKSINGTMLPKPFHMDTIQELIQFTLKRR